jgi:NADPH:quinone reductase
MNFPATMKAVQLSRFGAPEVLELVELAMPKPGQGEIRVRIRAAGVNFFEVLVRQNRYAVTPELPTVPGVEAAGVVEALGEGVDPDLLGKRVAIPMFAIGRYSGGYAQYIAVKAADVVPLPDGVAFEEATALVVQGLSALLLLREASPKNKTIAVTAAAGGVGSLLIQLAKRAGAKSIIALTSTSEKLRLAESLGADFALDYRSSSWVEQAKEHTGGAGPDIIYDSVGGPLTRTLLTALAPSGQLVFAALSRCQLAAQDLEKMFHQNQSIRGFALLPLLNAATLKEDLSSLFNLAQSGNLKVLIGGRYPLANAAGAHRALENRLTTGKVVLIP